MHIKKIDLDLKKMSIKQKIIYLIIASFLILIIIFNIYISITMFFSFKENTNNDLKVKSEYLINTVNYNLSSISSTAKNISQLKSIHNANTTQNATEGLKTFLNQTLKTYDLDFIILTNNENELIYSIFEEDYPQHVEEKKNKREVSIESTKQLNYFLNSQKTNYLETPNTQGLVSINSETYFITNQPVLSMNSETSFVGSISFGKKLSDNFRKEIKTISGIDFSIVSSAEIPKGEELNEIVTIKNIIKKLKDKSSINTVYVSTNDFFGQPTLSLKIDDLETLNTVIMQSKTLIFYSSITVVLALLAVVILMYFMMDKIVIKPLNILKNEVEEVANRKNGNIRTKELRTEEFIFLGNAIQNMLEKINLKAKAMESLNFSLRLYSQALNSTSDQIIIFGQNYEIVYANPSFIEFLNTSKKNVINTNIVSQISIHQAELFKSIIHFVSKGNFWQGNLVFRKTNSSNEINEVTISQVIAKNESSKRFILVKRNDVTKQLEHIVNHDNLTGLPNRAYFFSKLESIIADASEKNYLVHVFLIDIDKFKFMNDTLGHVLGDQLIKRIAGRLVKNFSDNYFVARVDGDEFSIIVTETKNVSLPVLSKNLNIKDEKSDKFDSEKFASVIHEIVGKTFKISEKKVTISSSIGSSSFPKDSLNSESLIKNADVAMHSAKFIGRNKYVAFEYKMHETIMSKTDLEFKIKSEIQNGGNNLIPFFQAKVDLKTNKIVGCEALVRWKHKDSFVFPNKFIPIVEENGLIVEMTKLMIEKSCMFNQTLIEKGYESIVSVNVSSQVLLHEKFLKMVNDALEKSGMAPKFLDIEITEGTLMTEIDKTNSVFNTLNKKGISISVDDFGTGYSSLSYLKIFHVDRIKIDRGFIIGMPENTDDLALVKAIIAMAKALSLKITAEGVETVEQVDCLKELGCDELQGYYANKPMPQEEYESFMEKYNLQSK